MCVSFFFVSASVGYGNWRCSFKIEQKKIYRSHGLLWFAKSQNDSKQSVHVKLIIKFYLFPKTECSLPAKYLAIFILFVYGCVCDRVCVSNRESFIYVQNKLPKNMFLFHFTRISSTFFWFSGCAICPLFDYVLNIKFFDFCEKMLSFYWGDIHRYFYSPISTFMLLSSIVCVFCFV